MPALPRTRAARMLAVAGLAAILFLTLQPMPDESVFLADTPLSCLVCGEAGFADVLRNLLLFAPFATGLRWMGLRWRTCTLACALLSLGVETAQWLGIPGRDASLSDLLTNSMGGAAFAAVAPYWATILQPPRPIARRLALAWLIAIAGVLAVTALAERSWPDPRPWWGQWQHDFPHRPRYAGRVLAVTLDGTPVPDGPLGDAARWRRSLADEHYAFAVRAVGGPAPDVGSRQLAGLAVEGDGINLEIQQLHGDLRAIFPLRYAPLRLGEIALVAPGAAPDPGDTAIAVMKRAGHTISFTVTGSRGVTTTVARLHPGLGWVLVSPWRPALGSRAADAASVAWLSALLLPLCWWVWRGAFGRREATPPAP